MSPFARDLAARIESVRGYLRRRAALTAALWVASGLVLLLAVAWLSVGSDGWRPGSNVPALLDALVVAWMIAGVAAYRAGTGRWFGEARLSRSIERAAGLREGIVRGSLEISRGVPDGVSTALVERAVAKTVSSLGPRGERELAGDLGQAVGRWTRRGMVAASVTAVGMAALGIASPGRTSEMWAGVSSPVRTMMDPVLAPIVVRPGTVEVMRGTDVLVEIEAQGRLEVEIRWQAAGDVARTELLTVEDGLSSRLFQGVSAATEYSVHAPDGAATETFRIVPIDPLFVADLVVSVEYPAYTGLPPDEYHGDPPPLRLPAGSRLMFEGLASRPLSEAGLVDSTGASVLGLIVDGATFGGTWIPRRGGVFPWTFRDRTGAPAEVQPEPLELELVADSIPSVAILMPGADTVLPIDLTQPLVVDARDDYGLQRFELVAYRVTAFGQREEPVVRGLDLAGTRAALARPSLDVSDWGLLPGDTVRYFARVVDNHPSGQVGVSREYVLRMPMVSELRREAEATLQQVAEKLEALREEAERQAEEAANQQLEVQAQAQQGTPEPRPGDPSQPGFERREEMRRAAEQQAALLSQVDSLSAQIEELQRMLEELGQADPELAAELEELQELLERLAEAQQPVEAQRPLEEQRDQAASSDSNQAPQLERDPEQLRQQIEETLQEFRRAAVEQDFRATTSEVEELARQERALADAMREADDPELRAEQQAQLTERAEQIDQQMQALSERLNQVEEQAAAADVEQARQTAAEARQQMQQAERQADQGNQQAAAQRAQQAANQMQQAADQMQQAQAGMQQQTQQGQQQALQQAADDALSLARSQSALMERMQGASQDQLSQMRSEQASIQRGLQNLAQGLQENQQQQGGGDPAMSAQVGRALEALDQAMQSLDGRRGSASEASQQAEQAISGLNQLAMMAMAGAQQAGSVAPGQSGQDIADQVGQLAQRQGDLVAKTGEMVPMRLGEQALRQQLQQISQQQGAVAQDIQTASQEPGAGDALGDLEELAREAERLAQQLAQGRMTPEVLQRQERLFHRLLDAGRSLEQEETSEEREAARPGEFERSEVVPLSDLQLGVMPYELPDGEQLRNLTPAVRQLVLEYFERLNRAPAEVAPPR